MPSPGGRFDTLTGPGTGRLDGEPGATVEWRFTDAGEPGRDDAASIVVRDPSGQVMLSAAGKLQNGNHQAHDE